MTSSAFNECVRRASRTFRVRFLKNGEPLNCEVKKVVTRKGACTEEFSPGMVYAPYIDAELLSCEASIENEELLLQTGLYLDDGTVEYINMGYFTVTKPERNAFQTTFQAVGRISSRLNVLPDLPEVKSLSNLANAITEKTGIRILTKGLTLGGTIAADLNGMTCREILEVMTSVLGGFATEDGEGNIVICKFSTTSLFEYNGDYVITPPKFNDYNYTVDGIKVVASSEQTDEDGNAVTETAYTEGSPKLTLLNEFMTEELFEFFAKNIVGYSFRPGEMQLTLGDPRIEPWDCISYTDVAGTTYTLPCLNLVHTFDGGFSTEITAKGKNETESDLRVKGPLQKQVERLNAELFTVKDAVANRIKAEEADLRYARVGRLDAVEAHIRVLEADTLKTKELEAAVATLGYARIDELEANYITAAEISSTYVKTEKLDAEIANVEKIFADYAKITDLNATNANVTNLSSDVASFRSTTTEKFDAQDASIKSLIAKDASLETLISQKASIDDLEATNADLENLTADAAEFMNLISLVLEAQQADIDSLSAKDAEIEDLIAEKATIEDLNSANADISNLRSRVATIEGAYITTAKVNTLFANYTTTTDLKATYATINSLSAATARIGTLESTTIKATELESKVAAFGYLESISLESEVAKLGYAKVSSLEAVDAKFSTLSSTYATIDLANVKAGSVTTAMIGSGVVGTAQIADGSITDAKIVGLTASKITAGTLDAGTIDVINLNAANITVGTINGQQIASGAIDTSKLASSLNSTISDASSNASQALENATLNYNKITSRGEQLIINGGGMLGDNTNFSSWIFDGAVANGTPGSFTRARGSGRATVCSDEYFPVNPDNIYTFSLDAKSLLGTGTLYSFLMFYDVDKNQIGAPQHMYVPGSTTTLARDLKAGDTVIYLTDASGWSLTAAYGFYLSIWNYKNNYGYTYPAETYTRNRLTLPKTSGNKLDSSCINYTAKTITLATAYSGTTVPAGTPVSQGQDGSTYKYTPLSNTTVPKTWTSYIGTMSGTDYSGQNVGGKFPPGVAYAKIGFLWNYNDASGEQQWITNISVTDTTAVNKAQTTADAKNAVFYQASTPSATGRKENDIWFDTDDGNRMHYWDGSAWVAKLFNTSAIAADAITSDKIVTGAITTAKLDAEAVTANKILAGTITSTQLDANEIFTNTANIGKIVASQTFSNAISTHSLVVSANSTAESALSKANSTESKLGNYQLKIIPDTRNDNQAPSWYLTNYPKQQVIEFKYCNVIGLANKGEIYCSLTTTVPWGDASGGYPKQTAKISGKEYWRVGVSANEWGAWNDVFGIAESASNLISSVNSVIGLWCFNNDTTYINGGKIYTGTIETNQIAANAITSDKIKAGAITAEKVDVNSLSALSADLGTVTAGTIQSPNFKKSDYKVDEFGEVSGTIGSGVKIDLTEKAYYTPQIIIKDNYISVIGYGSFGQRVTTSTIGAFSFTNGVVNIASGFASHAEGAETTANAHCAHAEGGTTKATGSYAHAEGWGVTASGQGAHAEGSLTVASGYYAHAEGRNVVASGDGSHAEGYNTLASSENQHVQGKYNVEDASGTYAHIVGNGTSSKRSNAYALDWNGNAWYAGNIYEAGTALSSKYASKTHTHTLDYRLQAAQSTATGSDANSAVTTGFHYINGTTNRPSFNQNNGVTGNDYRILTTAYSAAWLQQIATDFRCDDIFYRRNQNGSWQSWRRLAFADECATVEHTHSYLPLSGGTLSGILNISQDKAQINLRPGHDSYDGVISYQTSGNEAMVFSTKNAVTSFMFVNGEDTVKNITSSRWQSLTPGLQIKNNCVAIGKLIPNGTTPSYALDVGGKICASGETLTGELLFNTGTTQSVTKGIKWAEINSKNPYIGYAADQTDGTFVVASLLGTNYASGLAIGGGSGNLLYKGNVVLNASNWSTYCAAAGHTHEYSGHNGDRSGVIKIGKVVIEFGSVAITIGNTENEGLYTGAADITYSTKFKYAPTVQITWSGHYNNMHSVGTKGASTTGVTIWAKTSSATTTSRSVQWVAIGCVA